MQVIRHKTKRWGLGRVSGVSTGCFAGIGALVEEMLCSVADLFVMPAGEQRESPPRKVSPRHLSAGAQILP